MISINNISIHYGKKKVLKDLSLTLNEGLIHGVVGLNGEGKTTLFNAIFGLIKKHKGDITINGKALLKKEIAFLPTEHFFYSYITGMEYLNIFKNDSFDTVQWNSIFHLPLNELVDNYSTGMKKKLAIMRILKQNKPIVLLDEPFNGLDMESCRMLHLILVKLKNAGKTIIISSHILKSLTALCDTIHYLNNGKIKTSVERENFNDFESEVFGLIDLKNDAVLDGLL